MNFVEHLKADFHRDLERGLDAETLFLTAAQTGMLIGLYQPETAKELCAIWRSGWPKRMI